MESFGGIASDVRLSVSVDGQGDQQVRTTHIALLRLSGRIVRISANAPLAIRDGDRLTVVGDQRGDMFEALAHDNLTTGTTRDDGWISSIVIGVLIFCMGAVWLDLALGLLKHPETGPARFGPLGVAFASLLGGVVLALRSARVWRAGRQLRRT